MIGNDWDERLKDEWNKPYYQELRSFLIDEYKNSTVYPPAADIYNALRLTPYDDVKVVILGQDPYHEPGQAQGLSFSVPRDVAMPPSLVNILKELETDKDAFAGKTSGANPANGVNAGLAGGPLGGANANLAGSPASGEDRPAARIDGVLVPWAKQGVLLLNTVLTVRAHQAGSHRGKGWETFTDKVIELLAQREKPMVFILWGANAGAKRDLIIRSQSTPRHLIIQAPHPSPLSAYRGFFGGRYFSRSNYFLRDNGIEPVDWTL